jgi:hypothetical protein
LNGIDGRENGLSDGSNAGQRAISISIGTPLSSSANPILLSVFSEECSIKMLCAEIHIVFS